MNSNENLSPSTLREIIKETQDILSKPPEGIKLIPNEDDVTDVQVLIEGPEGTPYEGGVFKVKLVCGPDFPSVPPKGYFITKIFHPNVSKKGEICVNTLKKDWNPNKGLKHVLITIKCLLIVPNPESALNEEAGKLLLEKYEDYAKHARLMTSIHAKKLTMNLPTSTSKSEETEEKETCANSTSNSNNTSVTSSEETDTKKPKLSNVKETPPPSSHSSNTSAKKKVEKKKSLKRL